MYNECCQNLIERSLDIGIAARSGRSLMLQSIVISGLGGDSIFFSQYAFRCMSSGWEDF